MHSLTFSVHSICIRPLYKSCGRTFLPVRPFGAEKLPLSCYVLINKIPSTLFCFVSLLSFHLFFQSSLVNFILLFVAQIIPYSSRTPFPSISVPNIPCTHNIHLDNIVTFTMNSKLISLLASAALASANPVISIRAVTSLDQTAVAEAHQRDDTATRASSNINIKVCPAFRLCLSITKLIRYRQTSDGKCLSVDKLSGDFRANLTPIQVTQCGAAEGQGWDIITAGKHISTLQSMLIVSTTTGACFNFDPRRAAGDQVLLFSCGGRADGS